jgi:hypothetical protein
MNKVEFQRSQCIPKVAQIGMIMPYMNADRGEELPGLVWKQLTCAARLAVTHVNARFGGIVEGLGAMVGNLTHLTGIIYDTGYSATPATISYRQMIVDGGTAMVAAARSAVSGPLATQGKIDQIPQCSYWSSSPSLSDVLQYPYCERAASCTHPRSPASRRLTGTRSLWRAPRHA